jgi:hypothetical protein
VSGSLVAPLTGTRSASEGDAIILHVLGLEMGRLCRLQQSPVSIEQLREANMGLGHGVLDAARLDQACEVTFEG